MFLRWEINWELKIDEGWGEMGKMWPGSSDSLKKPSLEMTGTWYSPGSFRNLKHEPQSKAGTQGVEKLGCAHTNFRPSPWGLHSCVSAHVCVCTRREVALIPPCFWLALWAVKWLCQDEKALRQRHTCWQLKSGSALWRSQSEEIGAGWCQTLWRWNELIIVRHLASSPPRVSTPQRAWLTQKLDRCSLEWFNIFGWILFLFLTFSFGILNHD